MEESEESHMDDESVMCTPSQSLLEPKQTHGENSGQKTTELQDLADSDCDSDNDADNDANDASETESESVFEQTEETVDYDITLEPILSSQETNSANGSALLSSAALSSAPPRVLCRSGTLDVSLLDAHDRLHNQRESKKRKHSPTSPPSSDDAVTGEKGTLSFISTYLESMKATIYKDFENALDKIRDEYTIMINFQNKEIELLNQENSKLHDEHEITKGRLTRKEKELEDLKEQMLANEARSMKENLLFYNIPEVNDTRNDDPTRNSNTAGASNREAQRTVQTENCVTTLRNFMRRELKMKEEDVHQIRIDRAHRIGPKKPNATKPRVIVAKFYSRDSKDTILKHAKNLDKRKKFGINEQLPRELEERKKQLLPAFKEAKNKQLNPKWSNDKLIVGNKVQSAKKDHIADVNLNSTDIATSLKVTRSPPLVAEKSTYQGHVIPVESYDDIIPAIHAMYANTSAARANHNVYAYRIRSSGGRIIEHFEDDREWGAGKKILEVLQQHNITNKLVCVSRWYGGHQPGKARFDHITKAAGQALAMTNK